MIRQSPTWLWSHLRLRPTKKHVEVSTTIYLTRAQSLSLTHKEKEELEIKIKEAINSIHLANFKVIRCNLDDPIREGARSLFFGIIVISGNLSLHELSESAWAQQLLLTRSKIETYVVETSGCAFTLGRFPRRARGK